MDRCLAQIVRLRRAFFAGDHAGAAVPVHGGITRPDPGRLAACGPERPPAWQLRRDSAGGPPSRAGAARRLSVPHSSHRPTVSRDIISLVASRCGDSRGQIEHRVAHEFAVYVATQRGRAARPPHRHPLHAQPVASMRECPCRHPWLTPRSCTDQTSHRDQGSRGGRTRQEQRPQRFTVPREAMPARLASFRLLPMASQHWMRV